MSDSAKRVAMIESQLRTNDVTDARLIKAVGEIDRARFVPPHLTSVAYMEACVPLGSGRVLADPRAFAKLAQLAAVRASDRVLDVGCGTGYSAAVLSHLAAEVVALEEDETLARAASANLHALARRNVEVVHGPLAAGWHGKAPFDVIFVNGAFEIRPDGLLAQLNEGGRLVGVSRSGAAGQGCLYLKHEDALSRRTAFDAQLPLLPGFARMPGFVF